MPRINQLRIDPENEFPAVDYRVNDGHVQCRLAGITGEWHTLTPEQLTSRIMSSPVLGHWLSHRMGVFSVVRACNHESVIENARSFEAAA